MHELILYVACPNDTTANVQGYANISNKIVTDQCPQSSRHSCKTLLQLSLVWLEFLIITIFFLLVYHIVTRPCIYFSLSVSGLRCESSNLSRDTQTSLSWDTFSSVSHGFCCASSRSSGWPVDFIVCWCRILTPAFWLVGTFLCGSWSFFIILSWVEWLTVSGEKSIFVQNHISG